MTTLSEVKSLTNKPIFPILVPQYFSFSSEENHIRSNYIERLKPRKYNLLPIFAKRTYKHIPNTLVNFDFVYILTYPDYIKNDPENYSCILMLNVKHVVCAFENIEGKETVLFGNSMVSLAKFAKLTNMEVAHLTRIFRETTPSNGIHNFITVSFLCS